MILDLLFGVIMLLLFFKTKSVFYLIIFAIIAILSIASAAFNKTLENMKKEHDAKMQAILNGDPICPPHKWEKSENGNLICKICKKELS